MLQDDEKVAQMLDQVENFRHVGSIYRDILENCYFSDVPLTNDEATRSVGIGDSALDYSLEYFHEGQEDQCFVCAIEKSDVIEAELEMCGYFCIITSDKMTAKEALELYKSRDASEKLFKADKSFLGNRSLRVYTGDALEGKMLIAFVALIIINRMYTKIKYAEEEMLEKPNYMNVPAAIRELEKIEMIRQADGVYRLDHAVTATQKTILKAFGIDANYIKRKTKEISDWLNHKVKTVKF